MNWFDVCDVCCLSQLKNMAKMQIINLLPWDLEGRNEPKCRETFYFVLSVFVV